jgi:mannitol-1-phosphate/altronate dehydrogenase
MSFLCEATLHAVSPRLVQPSDDRRQLTMGIVHLGVGAFQLADHALST